MFRFSLIGVAELLSAIDNLQERVTTIDWVWNDDLEEYIAQLQGEHFDSEGGGNWPDLNERYAARKERTHPGQPIEVLNGALRESMVRPKDSANGIWDAAPSYLDVGSSLIYAQTQSEGDESRNIPARSLWSPELLSGEGVALLFHNELQDFAAAQGWPIGYASIF